MTSISAIASLLDSTTMPNNEDRQLSWSAHVISSTPASIELRGKPVSEPGAPWWSIIDGKRSSFHVARVWLTESVVNKRVTLVMIEAYYPDDKMQNRDVYDLAAHQRADITAQDVVDIILDYISAI